MKSRIENYRKKLKFIKELTLIILISYSTNIPGVKISISTKGQMLRPDVESNSSGGRVRGSCVCKFEY